MTSIPDAVRRESVVCDAGRRPTSAPVHNYGRYAPSALHPLLRYVNLTLVAWAMRKFKRFVGHKVRASQFLIKIAGDHAHLFVHWRLGMTGTFI